MYVEHTKTAFCIDRSIEIVTKFIREIITEFLDVKSVHKNRFCTLIVIILQYTNSKSLHCVPETNICQS